MLRPHFKNNFAKLGSISNVVRARNEKQRKKKKPDEVPPFQSPLMYLTGILQKFSVTTSILLKIIIHF